MKRNIFLGLLVIAGLPFLSSCDDEKPKPAGITFELADQGITESDGTLESFHPLMINGAAGREIEIKVMLDKPAAQTAVLDYTVAGTATRNTASAVGDFEIEGNTLTVEKGATEAIMKIKLFEDFELEDEDVNDDGIPFETIVVTLASVVSGPLKIGEANTHTINILEDDLKVNLKWNSHQATQAGDVDMDLFLWIDDPTEGYGILDYSLQAGNKFESLSIPAGFPDGGYAFSYTYYSGTSNDVDVIVDFTNYGGKLNGGASTLQFTADRDLTNINKYDEEGSPDFKGDPVIVQTIEKNGFNYIELSVIGNPGAGTGSRIKSKINPEITPSFFKGIRTKPKTLRLK